MPGPAPVYSGDRVASSRVAPDHRSQIHRSPQRHGRRRCRRSRLGIVLYSALLMQVSDREVPMRYLTRERHSKFGVYGYEVLGVSNHFFG